MADGIIQQEELDTLSNILKDHAWAKEIKWSFDYEAEKAIDIEETYKKVINFCHSHGPSVVYPEFIESLETLEETSCGTNAKEDKVISSFSSDLIERLQADLGKI